MTASITSSPWRHLKGPYFRWWKNWAGVDHLHPRGKFPYQTARNSRACHTSAHYLGREAPSIKWLWTFPSWDKTVMFSCGFLFFHYTFQLFLVRMESRAAYLLQLCVKSHDWQLWFCVAEQFVIDRLCGISYSCLSVYPHAVLRMCLSPRPRSPYRVEWVWGKAGRRVIFLIHTLSLAASKCVQGEKHLPYSIFFPLLLLKCLCWRK